MLDRATYIVNQFRVACYLLLFKWADYQDIKTSGLFPDWQPAYAEADRELNTRRWTLPVAVKALAKNPGEIPFDSAKALIPNGEETLRKGIIKTIGSTASWFAADVKALLELKLESPVDGMDFVDVDAALMLYHQCGLSPVSIQRQMFPKLETGKIWFAVVVNTFQRKYVAQCNQQRGGDHQIPTVILAPLLQSLARYWGIFSCNAFARWWRVDNNTINYWAKKIGLDENAAKANQARLLSEHRRKGHSLATRINRVLTGEDKDDDLSFLNTSYRSVAGNRINNTAPLVVLALSAYSRSFFASATISAVAHLVGRDPDTTARALTNGDVTRRKEWLSMTKNMALNASVRATKKRGRSFLNQLRSSIGAAAKLYQSGEETAEEKSCSKCKKKYWKASPFFRSYSSKSRGLRWDSECRVCDALSKRNRH